MEIRIKSVHFDATEKLQEFINKKVEKLQKSYEDIQKVEVQRYEENRTWPNFSVVFCLVCLLFRVPTWSRAILGPQNPLGVTISTDAGGWKTGHLPRGNLPITLMVACLLPRS